LEILSPSVANSLFGWQLRAAVGQLTALQKEDFLTRLFVNYVIKLMKQHSIPWLLVFCARQVWTAIFHVLGLLPLAPKLEDSRFSSWWCKTIKAVPTELREGLNSLIILVAWELWKHRNACVFEGASPCVQRLLAVVSEECLLWCWAGAKALQQLLSRLLPIAA
jgi:hypothetical protein